MRHTLIAALMLLGSYAIPASAQVHVSIGINVPTYPVLQRVPGYPVYYAPRLNSNYFFYDGMYWVYEGDNWYASPWYNGPWDLVDRYDVPVYLLRVPVRYYRSAPVYFRGWRADAPPLWGVHWGSSWEQRRSGWDRWNRSSAPAPAPLPVYQRQYSGTRYPDRSQQVVIQTQSYRYQPREAVVQQRFQQYQASAPVSQPQPQRERRTSVQSQPSQVQQAQPRAQPQPSQVQQAQPRAQPQASQIQQAQPRAQPQPPIAQAPMGHPPGQAKGWEGEDRPPGKAKGWDKEIRENDDRGRGPPDREERGQGRNKENPGKGRDR